MISAYVVITTTLAAALAATLAEVSRRAALWVSGQFSQLHQELIFAHQELNSAHEKLDAITQKSSISVFKGK